MKVEFIDKMGDDLRAANAARVSFAKWKDEFDEKDAKLIAFLLRENHWAPLAHCQMTMRIKAPIFVARQLVKHTVGLVMSEESRRYITGDPEFFIPKTWRKKPANAKQGSGDYFNQKENSFSITIFDIAIRNRNREALELYKYYIDAGVAPEQARMVLPLNTYTNWIWTGSLVAFLRVVALRAAKDAQEETQFIAQEIAKLLAEHWPVCYNSFVANQNKEV